MEKAREKARRTAERRFEESSHMPTHLRPSENEYYDMEWRKVNKAKIAYENAAWIPIFIYRIKCSKGNPAAPSSTTA